VPTDRIMKKSVFPLAVLLALAMPATVHAQFLKGIFKRHKEKHHVAAVPPKTVTKKRQEIAYPQTIKKERYRIDILAQLYLNELVIDDKPAFKNKLPDKASAGVEFYEGALLAVDSLQAMGYNMDVFVHDVTAQTEFPSALINNKQLDTTNLIIGAINARDITEVATFANKHHVNLISALSPSDGGVNDDPYFTLLQPNLQKHCEFIKASILKKYPNSNVALFYRTNASADDNAYKYLTGSDTVHNFRTVLCNTLPDKAVLNILFDSTITNVVIVSIVDIGYAEKILALLNKDLPGYKFEVYGMPSWKSMSSIHKPDLYTNIGINISAPFYFNQNTPVGKYVERSFKARFNGRTSEMVYRGYETMFWYATLLHKYGTIFNEHVNEKVYAPFTNFKVMPQWDKNLDFLYSENEHLYLYRYQGGSYMIDP